MSLKTFKNYLSGIINSLFSNYGCYSGKLLERSDFFPFHLPPTRVFTLKYISPYYC